VARRVAFLTDPNRNRSRTLAGFVVGLLVVLAMLALAYRPATLFGVGGKSLAHSVASEMRSAGPLGGCHDRVGARWRCLVWDRGGSNGVPYEVETRRFGCWDARRLDPASSEGGTPRVASGCINGYDVLRPLDRL
jgi:hypothetical protein